MNKEELKKRIKRLSTTYFVAKRAVIDLVDQLDEPKIISQTQAVEFLAGEYNLTEDEVDNVLLNYRKPAIPQFVADDYENLDIWEKDEFRDIKWVLRTAYSPNVDTKKPEILTWVRNNPAAYVNMVEAIENGNGYTVKEKKYTVPLPGITKNGYQAYLFKAVGKKISLADNNTFEEMKFTEKEIKDYDERYFAFAEPVNP